MMESRGVPVIIAGAGPVGLSLSLALARQGVRSLVLEKEPALRPYSRALGILTRTLEIFRSWKALDPFLAEGVLKTTAELYLPGKSVAEAEVLDFHRLPLRTAIPGVLILPQNRTEAILLELARETGLADVRFGHEVTGFRDEPSGVVVNVAAGGEEYAVRGDYLVGCDGAHSTVRQRLGWHLEGKTYPTRVALADIRLSGARDELPWPRGAGLDGGILGAVRFAAGEWRLISTVRPGIPDEEIVSPGALTGMVDRLFGAGPFETLWASVFRIHCRTSPHFYRGRALLAGDAAHINSPAGGQGMNSGIEDAHNLAWKLAARLARGSEDLLVSYEQERRGAVLTKVDRYTDFLTRAVLMSHPWRRRLFLQTAKAALSFPGLKEQLALRASMLDTRYRGSALIGGSGRWLGRRAPDGALLTPDGSRLRLLDLAGPEAALLLFDDGRLPGWNEQEISARLDHVPRLRIVRVLHPEVAKAGYRDVDGALWEAWGATGDTAALVRPDGFVGWMGRRPSRAELLRGLQHALGWTAADSAEDERRHTRPIGAVEW